MAQIQHRQNAHRRLSSRRLNDLRPRLQAIKSRHRIPHALHLLLEHTHLRLMDVAHIADNPLLPALRVRNKTPLIRIPVPLRMDTRSLCVPGIIQCIPRHSSRRFRTICIWTVCIRIFCIWTVCIQIFCIRIVCIQQADLARKLLVLSAEDPLAPQEILPGQARCDHLVYKIPQRPDAVVILAVHDLQHLRAHPIGNEHIAGAADGEAVALLLII